MKITQLSIKNFRGISEASIELPTHAVLIGDNNTGKSTILEAINLAMGPDRLKRRPVVDEHDFYGGLYMATPHIEECDEKTEAASAPQIEIEAIVTDLNEEQIAHFQEFLEPWNANKRMLVPKGGVDEVDRKEVVSALRIQFRGWYDPEQDDFEAQTYFARSLEENPEKPKKFSLRDKQICGFLYLRAIRTGSRALSLEHGSLLDIILRLKELRPQMWEDTIRTLEMIDVASNEEHGISGVLETLNASLSKYVPKEWGGAPRLKVSALTRDHLRKVITAFMSTGVESHAAPFYRQGTGTINMLVLALLSQIAEDKQNVMFAMEEPETAIPPYAQKRIVHELRTLSAQSIVTSHSPYVLEEYELKETVALSRGSNGALARNALALPSVVKPRAYRHEFRTRFCEGLLGRRVLVTEGRTEADAMPAVARHLHALDPNTYSSLEALGLTIVDAGSETKVGPLGGFYRALGKTVYGLCDAQEPEVQSEISAELDELFMHDYHGFEDLVIKNTPEAAKIDFIKSIDWPPHLSNKHPDPTATPDAALKDFFKGSKGDGAVADFLVSCSLEQVPDWIKQTCATLTTLCRTPDGGSVYSSKAPTTSNTATVSSESETVITEAEQIDANIATLLGGDDQS